MDTDVRRGPRLAALAILVALTGALVHSVGLQGAGASRLPAAEVQMRHVCRDRLVRSIDKARADGEVELADWIESLPVYNHNVPVDAPLHPAAR